MKLRLVLIILLGALLGLTTGSATAADKPQTFRVGYNNWVGFLALFVAEGNGYFKAEGLDVKMKSFSAPGDGLKALLTGDLDLHLTTLDATVLAADKAPGQLKVVTFIDTSAGADAIVAKPEIKNPAGLKGRTVGATVGKCNHLLLLKALEKAGLKESDVKLTSMSPDDAGAAFAAGKLDAAVTWEPWITKIASAKQGKVIFSSKDTPNILVDCATISTATAEKKSAQTKAFLRALSKANALVIKEPEAAAKFGEKAFEMKAAEIAELLPKLKLYDAAGSAKMLGGGASGAVDELAAFFKASGANTSVVTAEKLFDASFLK